jgi:hypothetical protein
MKKLFTTLTAVFITIGIFAGCGTKEKTAETTAPQTSIKETTAPAKETKKTTSSTEKPGLELSTFMTDYSTVKGKLWETLSKKFEEEQNVAFLMGSMGFAFADLAIIDISLFDALEVKDGDVFKGKLLLSNIDAWKKVNGDVIEFGYDYIYKEDKANHKNGDHEVALGKFNKKNNTLYYERTSESNNKKTSRIVVEIVKNSNSSYSSQILFYNAEEEKSTSDLSAYLTWFEGEDISCYIAEKENTDVAFTFNSILDKKNAKPEEMSGGMKTVTKTSYIKGKAVFEDLSEK